MSAVAKIERTSKPQRVPLSGAQGLATSDELEINVVFTKMRAALKAVPIARRLAKLLGVRVRLLVPHIVPFPAPLDEPLVSAAFLAREFRAKVGDDVVETRIDIRLCRDRWQMLQGVLAPGSVIVLTGPGRWWPSAERRLARRLEAEGHNVIFSYAKE